MSLSSLLVPAILFFALGMFACLIKSDLKFPPDMHRMIVIYLLIGIGLHGGKELAAADMGDALSAVWAALAFGIVLPIIAYIILRGLGKIDPLNAAAISAHYGSVSAGTYMTAVAFLGGIGVTYEAYPVIMLAIMESPAIMIGLVLAGYSRRVMGGTAKTDKGMMKHLLIDAFTNAVSCCYLAPWLLVRLFQHPVTTKSNLSSSSSLWARYVFSCVIWGWKRGKGCLNLNPSAFSWLASVSPCP